MKRYGKKCTSKKFKWIQNYKTIHKTEYYHSKLLDHLCVENAERCP